MKKTGPKPINRPRFQGSQRCPFQGKLDLYKGYPNRLIVDVKRCMLQVDHDGAHAWGVHVWFNEWRGER